MSNDRKRTRILTQLSRNAKTIISVDELGQIIFSKNCVAFQKLRWISKIVLDSEKCAHQKSSCWICCDSI